MAETIRTVLHIPMEECFIGSYPEAFGIEVANRMDFNNFTPIYLHDDEDDAGDELELINKVLIDFCVRGNAYGHIIERIPRGTP